MDFVHNSTGIPVMELNTTTSTATPVEGINTAQGDMTLNSSPYYTTRTSPIFTVDFAGVDWVNVVRCKKCKHFNPSTCECELTNTMVEEEDYCSYGAE